VRHGRPRLNHDYKVLNTCAIIPQHQSKKEGGENEYMSKPLEAGPEQKQLLTADALLEPGKIESLVKSGRIPAVIPCKIGGEKRALVMIPPEGTQFGDRFNFILGSYKFESPEGKDRGEVETIDISRDQIETIRSRTAKALKEHSKLPPGPAK
jgi:hypothetical protein